MFIIINSGYDKYRGQKGRIMGKTRAKQRVLEWISRARFGLNQGDRTTTDWSTSLCLKRMSHLHFQYWLKKKLPIIN